MNSFSQDRGYFSLLYSSINTYQKQWIAYALLSLAYLILEVGDKSMGMIGAISFLSILLIYFFTAHRVMNNHYNIRAAVFNTGTLILTYLAFYTSLEELLISSIYSINYITTLDFKSLTLLIIIVLAFNAIFKMSYNLRDSLRGASLNSRLLCYGIVGSVIIAYTYHSIDNTVLTTIMFASYFLLLDVFYDQDQPSLVWLILWTVFLGSFLSITIFHIESNILLVSDIPLVDAFSLFSLVFFLSGILYLPLAYANDKLFFLPVQWSFTLKDRSILRNRIQFSVLITLVFCFVTIGVVSIYQIRSWDIEHPQMLLHQEFIQALLNTYVFLFLIGLIISIRLSEYIRTPLIQLGNTMKAAKLNENDQIIDWKGSDEISDLINEYNTMIIKLRENAELIAQSERDSAWREMSQQVAHEIKNPLTPMKLSLQHLQYSINQKRDNIEELTVRMVNTLMNQIENLKEIADEFSNIGSLPKTQNKKVILNEIVEAIHDLFRQRGDMDIRLVMPIDDIGAYADKNNLLRILNNLVKNSIQAIPEDRKGLIILQLYKENNKAIISVKDNGAGISDPMKSQIFKPKFTTKSSGSGLGLAIAANMVDSFGGSIYFESNDGLGTTFFVELPMIRTLYSEEMERVEL